MPTQGGMLAPGGMHTQGSVPAGSACGVHTLSDGVMHTRAGARTHDNGTMHTTSAGESDGIADRQSGMHRQIGMPMDSACGAQKMSDGVTRTGAGMCTHDSGAMHLESAGKSGGTATDTLACTHCDRP